MKVITARNNQTMVDLAIQYYGGAEGVELLIIDNNLTDGFMHQVLAGMTYKIISAPINKDVVDYYSKNKIVPVSKTNPDFLIPDFNPEDFE